MYFVIAAAALVFYSCANAAAAQPTTVVIGITGSGKSSLVNALVGSKVAPVNDLSTGTFDVNCYPAEHLGGSLICDTMGFFDGLADARGQFNNADILDAISTKIESISSLILVVDPTSESRQGYMAQQRNMLIAARLAFGEKIWTERTAIVVSKSETFGDAGRVFEYIEKLLGQIKEISGAAEPPAAIIPIEYTNPDATRIQLERRTESLRELKRFIEQIILDFGPVGVPIEFHLSADLGAVLGVEETIAVKLEAEHEKAKQDTVDIRSRMDEAKLELEESSKQLELERLAESNAIEAHKRERERLHKEEQDLIARTAAARRLAHEEALKQEELMKSSHAQFRHNIEMANMYRDQARRANEMAERSMEGGLFGAVVGGFVGGMTGGPAGLFKGMKIGSSVGTVTGNKM